MTERVFQVMPEVDGGYCAECLTEGIFTQGDSWEELWANVRKVIGAFHLDGMGPERIRLRLFRDEVVPVT